MPPATPLHALHGTFPSAATRCACVDTPRSCRPSMTPDTPDATKLLGKGGGRDQCYRVTDKRKKARGESRPSMTTNTAHDGPQLEGARDSSTSDSRSRVIVPLTNLDLIGAPPPLPAPALSFRDTSPFSPAHDGPQLSSTSDSRSITVSTSQQTLGSHWVTPPPPSIPFPILRRLH